MTQERETNRDEHVSRRQESASRVLFIGRVVTQDYNYHASKISIMNCSLLVFNCNFHDAQLPADLREYDTLLLCKNFVEKFNTNNFI